MGNLFKGHVKYDSEPQLYHESGEAFKPLNRVLYEAISLGNEGKLLIQLNRHGDARRVLEASIVLCQRLQFKAEGVVFTYLARVAHFKGPLAEADTRLQRSETLLRASKQRYHLGVLICERGLWALASADSARAK